MTTKDVFVRKASGLVREISVGDALMGNILIFNLVIASSTLIIIPYLFPGANLPVSVLVTFPLAMFLALVYVLFAVAMPRSGGDYVYISRTLHPALGFAANFTVIGWNMLWIGVYCNWVSTVGLSGMFATLGNLLDIPSLTDLGSSIVEPLPAILIGTVVNVLMAVLIISGLRRTLTVQKILFAVAIVGVAIAVIVIGVAGADAFKQDFNTLASYDGVITTASENGLAAVSDWGQGGPTVQASLLVALSLMFAMFSQYAGGELKDVKKNVPISILGTVVLGTVGIFLMALVAAKTWKPDFLASIQYLFYDVPDAYPLAVPPTYDFLASLSTKAPLIIVVIGLGFTLWSVAAIIFNHLVNSRCIFSWAFDRIFPRKFSEVDDRFHSPIPAILLTFGVAELFLIYYTYNPTVTFLAGTTMGYMLAFATTAVAAIVFPYKLKKIYEDSPANISVAGIPLIVISGVVTIGWFLYMIYTFMVNDVFGANAPEGLFFMLFLWILGFIIFFIAKYYRRSQEEIDIDMAYKELPPE